MIAEIATGAYPNGIAVLSIRMVRGSLSRMAGWLGDNIDAQSMIARGRGRQWSWNMAITPDGRSLWRGQRSPWHGFSGDDASRIFVTRRSRSANCSVSEHPMSPRYLAGEMAPYFGARPWSARPSLAGWTDADLLSSAERSAAHSLHKSLAWPAPSTVLRPRWRLRAAAPPPALAGGWQARGLPVACITRLFIPLLDAAGRLPPVILHALSTAACFSAGSRQAGLAGCCRTRCSSQLM